MLFLWRHLCEVVKPKLGLKPNLIGRSKVTMHVGFKPNLKPKLRASIKPNLICTVQEFSKT